VLGGAVAPAALSKCSPACCVAEARGSALRCQVHCCCCCPCPHCCQGTASSLGSHFRGTPDAMRGCGPLPALPCSPHWQRAGSHAGHHTAVLSGERRVECVAVRGVRGWDGWGRWGGDVVVPCRMNREPCRACLGWPGLLGSADALCPARRDRHLPLDAHAVCVQVGQLGIPTLPPNFRAAASQLGFIALDFP